MSSALQSTLPASSTAARAASPAPAGVPIMNKPIHSQGGGSGSTTYGQQNNLAHMGAPTGPHHQWGAVLNMNYQAPSGQPIASNHPVQMNYNPPKNPINFGQAQQQQQQQHPANLGAMQNIPSTPSQIGSDPERPQSNGTLTDAKSAKVEQNHINAPTKETVQSPEKARVTPEKSTTGVASEPKATDSAPAESTESAANSSQPVAASSASKSESNSAVGATSTSATIQKEATSTPEQTTATTTAAAATSSSAPVTKPADSNAAPKVSPPAAGATAGNATATPAQDVSDKSTEDASVSAEEEEEEADDKSDGSDKSDSESEEAATPPKEVAPKQTKSATSRVAPHKPKAPKQADEAAPKTTKSNAAPAEPKTPSPSKAAAGGSAGSGKVKRSRTRTQPYQSPLPELELISKMTNVTTPRSRNNEEKLIIFYKNEFLAVRSSDGGFYVCQAVQNVYKSSPKIRIRWLSQDKNEKSGELYTPDFYDNTDFECILTNLNLSRMDKGRYRLPAKEKERTDNILKRAIAVEKGEATALDDSLTEDNPDGLDVSLYKDEEQLKKRKGTKRKSSKSKPASSPTRSPSTRKTPDAAKVRRVASSPKSTRTPPKTSSSKRTPARRTPAAVSSSSSTSPASESVKKSPAVGRAERAKRRAVAEADLTPPPPSAKRPAPAPASSSTGSTPTAETAKKSPAAAAAVSGGRAERAKRRGDGEGGDTVAAAPAAPAPKTSPVVDQKKAKLIAKVTKRTAVVASQSPAVTNSTPKAGASHSSRKKKPVRNSSK